MNLDNLSDAQRLIISGQLEGFLSSLTEDEARELLYDWSFWSRPNQRPPSGVGDRFRVWFFRAGRGSGKTRAGAEMCRQMIEVVDRVALVAPTAPDARDVMVEGESGLLSVFPPEQRPDYQPSRRRIVFHNGAQAFTYSAEEPERLRGPQHGWAWVDEPASMPRGQDAIDNLLLGLRLGARPWALFTGTPKPRRWLRELSDRTETISTTGTTYENEQHLAPGFIEDILGRYEGTRIGRQELYAEWLDDTEGALWTERTIDAARMTGFDPARPWHHLNVWLSASGAPSIIDRRAWRTIVAVDPPGETAECGIVVAAAPTQGRAGVDHAVILEDASIAGRPEEWGAQVVAAAHRWHAERVIVESNQGGDMTRATIHAVDPEVRVDKLTASISKAARAEPISALYERRLVHHVGFFPRLEAQMCSWVPGQERSPDRMDALVHAVAHLLTEQPIVRARVLSPAQRRI